MLSWLAGSGHDTGAQPAYVVLAVNVPKVNRLVTRPRTAAKPVCIPLGANLGH